MKPAKGRIGRYITLTEELDKWLEKEAKKRGFRSVQEYMLDIFRREKVAVASESVVAA